MNRGRGKEAKWDAKGQGEGHGKGRGDKGKSQKRASPSYIIVKKFNTKKTSTKSSIRTNRKDNTFNE